MAHADGYELNAADEYQRLAARTLISEPGFVPVSADLMLVWNALGVAGEAGELVDLVKKGVFHRHGVDDVRLRREVGDVLWYLAAICTGRGWRLSEMMAENIEKLRVRYPDGFSPDASRTRAGREGGA